MGIKNIINASVQTDKNIRTVMQSTNEISRNSCLDACTCTGNCE